eukprot:COSAG06_NODE_663_length_13295_cov_33.836945_17_plen_137_part_00
MRTLVGEATGRADWRADALEYGKFLWERALMRVRTAAPLDDLLAAMRVEIGMREPAGATAAGAGAGAAAAAEAAEAAEAAAAAAGAAAAAEAGAGSAKSIDASTLRKVLGNFGEVLPQVRPSVAFRSMTATVVPNR